MKKIRKVGLQKVKEPKYVAVLKQIEEDHGIITPYMVVEAAKKADSPLHNAFEWDDTKAAEKFRIVQARMLINSVRVEIMGQKTEGYINAIVHVDNVASRGYVSTEVAMNDDFIYKQVLKNATRELEYWQKKYRMLKDLQGIVNEEKVEELRRKIS